MSDKWSSYLDVYEGLFSSLRHNPLDLLEIGVQNGGSIEIWAEYFANARRIVGCDVDPRCANLKFDDPRVSIVIGDAGTEAAAAAILAIQDAFDIVIDDGSHRPKDIVCAFARYFPTLRDGGLYVIEDLHCSYLSAFEGGLFEPFSSIEFFKLFADVVNAEHFLDRRRPSQLLQEFTERFDADFADEALRSVHCVRFVNSMCIVSKRSMESNLLGIRIIPGGISEVDATIKAFEGSSFNGAGGGSRKEEDRDSPWNLRIARLEALMADRDRDIALLQDLVAARDRDFALKQELANWSRLVSARESQIDELLRSTSWRLTRPLRMAGALVRRGSAALRTSK